MRVTLSSSTCILLYTYISMTHVLSTDFNISYIFPALFKAKDCFSANDSVLPPDSLHILSFLVVCLQCRFGGWPWGVQSA